MKVDVLIIGGGATGAGTFRDLAMRGASVMLVEQGDFCAGASGGNHGMLHSGARYAVKDPVSAKECAQEGKVLKQIARDYVQDVGGLFVQTGSDPEVYEERFTSACKEAGVWTEAIDRADLMHLEPALSREVRGGYRVLDAAIDPFHLVLSNIRSGRASGGMARNHLVVESMLVEDGRIIRVLCRERRNGAILEIRPGMVVNASGAAADHVARMAGCHVDLVQDVGTMVVLNGRLVSHLINRLRPPADGDILVPHHTTTILGTTSRKTTGSGPSYPSEEEVNQLLMEGEVMVPGITDVRTIRAYAGVRPLIPAKKDSRDIARGCLITDHKEQGVCNLVSIIGGKLTTYRLMAEKVSDLVSGYLSISGSCRTSKEDLVPIQCEGTSNLDLIHKESQIRRYGTIIESHMPVTACSCEQVTREELAFWAREEDVWTVQDLMRRSRAGFGYCQGAGCALDMVEAMVDKGRSPSDLLDEHWNERRGGITPVLHGDQLRQEVFRSYLFEGFYGVKGGKR